jgi:hypothetical protein
MITGTNIDSVEHEESAEEGSGVRDGKSFIGAFLRYNVVRAMQTFRQTLAACGIASSIEGKPTHGICARIGRFLGWHNYPSIDRPTSTLKRQDVQLAWPRHGNCLFKPDAGKTNIRREYEYTELP